MKVLLLDLFKRPNDILSKCLKLKMKEQGDPKESKIVVFYFV